VRKPFNYVSVAWNYNLPLNNKDFVGNGSTAGFLVGYRRKINNRIYGGVDFNYVVYNSYHPRQTVVVDNGATTTDAYNYQYTYGFTINGDYVFRPFKKLMPFAGLGLGLSSNEYKTFYNVFNSSDYRLGLLVRPQVGALLKLGKESRIALSGVVQYDYSSAASDKFNISGMSSLAFRVGVAINITDKE
jgi:opacity protein-like surface antigen